MIRATINFAGHEESEHREIESAPKIGDSIDGPETQGILWRVSGVFSNSATGETKIACEAVAAPRIVGNAAPCPLTS